MAVAKWCGHDSRGLSIPKDDIPSIIDRLERYLANEELTFDHLGFVIKSSEIVDDIYLPKYYNPELAERILALGQTHNLVSLGDLADAGKLRVTTGDEIGKLAYGTGRIPFIRTSDIVNWEFKTDPKHGVSQDIYEQYCEKQDVRTGDILMVRDGTYLVGTVGVVTDLDQKILFQSHILKFTSTDPAALSPYLLLALLSAPIVKEQIWSKRFTQDIIDTLGQRWREIVVPIPKDQSELNGIIGQVTEAVDARVKARMIARSAVMRVAPHDEFDLDANYEFSVLRK